MDSRKRVAVFGGSFNPPTNAHMLMAAETLNLRAADEVWFVPCGTRDDKVIETNANRLEMLSIAVAEFFPSEAPVKIDDIEMRNGRLIPTYYLMKGYEESRQDIEFFFAIGSDLLPTLTDWNEGEKLCQEINFLVLERVGYPIELKFLPKKFQILRNAVDGASSTLVRTRLSEDWEIIRATQKATPTAMDFSLLGLLPKGVIKYIVENRLYDKNSTR